MPTVDDNIFSGLSPEIVHFRTANDGLDSNGMVPRDWYIKGARYGFDFTLRFFVYKNCTAGLVLPPLSMPVISFGKHKYI